MGQIFSSFKSKRREKADRERRLKERIVEAEECIAYLQEQQKILNQTLQEHYMYYPALRPEHRDEKERRTAEIENEIEALERKLFIEEISLDVAYDRCDLLNRNAGLLRLNEVGLYSQRSIGQQNVAALKLKHEACQFSLHQKANPIERWTTLSLPNLYFASV